MNFQIIATPGGTDRKRVCCNCNNNKRIRNSKGIMIDNRCAIDGHYIGYADCFEHWCRHWCKEKVKG